MTRIRKQDECEGPRQKISFTVQVGEFHWERRQIRDPTVVFSFSFLLHLSSACC